MTKMHPTEAVLRGRLEAFNNKEADTAMEFFAKDAELVIYTTPRGVYTGHAAIADLIRDYFESYPDLELEIIDLVADESHVAAQVQGRGTPKGEAEPIEARYCTFQVHRDGKIISEDLYLDNAEVPG